MLDKDFGAYLIDGSDKLKELFISPKLIIYNN
jgi:hypothetical protein